MHELFGDELDEDELPAPGNSPWFGKFSQVDRAPTFMMPWCFQSLFGCPWNLFEVGKVYQETTMMMSLTIQPSAAWNTRCLFRDLANYPNILPKAFYQVGSFFPSLLREQKQSCLNSGRRIRTTTWACSGGQTGCCNALRILALSWDLFYLATCREQCQLFSMNNNHKPQEIAWSERSRTEAQGKQDFLGQSFYRSGLPTRCHDATICSVPTPETRISFRIYFWYLFHNRKKFGS